MAPTFNFHFYELSRRLEAELQDQANSLQQLCLTSRVEKDAPAALDPEADDLNVYYRLHHGSTACQRHRIPRRSGLDRIFRVHKPP